MISRTRIKSLAQAHSGLHMPLLLSTVQKRNLQSAVSRRQTSFIPLNIREEETTFTTLAKVFAAVQVFLPRTSAAFNSRSCEKSLAWIFDAANQNETLIFFIYIYPKFSRSSRNGEAMYRKARGGIVNFIVERGELVSVEAYLPTYPRPTHIYIIIKHCNARLMHTFSYSKPCFRLLTSARYSICAPLFLLFRSLSPLEKILCCSKSERKLFD